MINNYIQNHVQNIIFTMEHSCYNHSINIIWPTSFLRILIALVLKVLMLRNPVSSMAYLRPLGSGCLICQIFVKHQNSCGLWPRSLKWNPLLVTFSFHPADLIHFHRVIWSTQAESDLWHLTTCVPYFLCERNKWQAWRLSPTILFLYSGVLPAELNDPRVP